MGWKSPERLQDKSQDDFADDVYAFGMVLFELIARETPWTGMTQWQIFSRVIEGQKPDDPKLANANPNLRALMDACSAKEPSARPDFEEIILQLEQLAGPASLSGTLGIS